MTFHKGELSVSTFIPSKWNSSNIDEETELNDNSTFWYSSLLPVDKTLRSWNETENGSDDYSNDYDFFKDYTLSFHFFDSQNIYSTSEAFEKTIVVLTLIIGLLGFVGNIVTICMISFHKKFHTPTFVAIGCLSLPDTLNIIVIFLTKFSNLYDYVAIQDIVYKKRFWNMTFLFLWELIKNSSNSHIVYLSMIRYLLTIHPLESKIRLTASIVLACSVMIWIYSSLFLAFILIFILRYFNNYTKKYTVLRYTFDIIHVLWGLFSLCAIIIMHIKKMKVLKNSAVKNCVHRRMNVIIFIILSVFVCFQISSIFYYLSFLINISPTYRYNIYVIFGIMNYSCNPYILFFSSLIV
ncbi:melanocyte-stimulating hormone receptor-like [Saccostrea cucullata]|uniref:melanocyte-stimulating hormone receptor-like n=1 Tax=Saccostrea cuccullata TaxID=36930 RepID=UPI002ED5A96C